MAAGLASHPRQLVLFFDFFRRIFAGFRPCGEHSGTSELDGSLPTLPVHHSLEPRSPASLFVIGAHPLDFEKVRSSKCDCMFMALCVTETEHQIRRAMGIDYS